MKVTLKDIESLLENKNDIINLLSTSSKWSKLTWTPSRQMEVQLNNLEWWLSNYRKETSPTKKKEILKNLISTHSTIDSRMKDLKFDLKNQIKDLSRTANDFWDEELKGSIDNYNNIYNNIYNKKAKIEKKSWVDTIPTEEKQTEKSNTWVTIAPVVEEKDVENNIEQKQGVDAKENSSPEKQEVAIEYKKLPWNKRPFEVMEKTLGTKWTPDNRESVDEYFTKVKWIQLQWDKWSAERNTALANLMTWLSDEDKSKIKESMMWKFSM